MSRFDLASVALRWLCGCWLLWHIGLVGRRSVRASPPAGSANGSTPDPADEAMRDRPPCSIVIPARNESATLPVLLASLADELHASDEVIVVDDDSDDDTAAVALARGAQVITAPPLRPGWTGKNSACWAGVNHASHEVVVFLDADTRMAPSGLDRLLAARADRGGLLSVQPFHSMRRAYERLSAFFNVVAMMGIDAFTPLGERRVPSGAFGPVLVTSRSDYEAAGGHRAIADQILDDVALSRRYADAGIRVTCLGGRGTVSFRMYPDGIRHVLEGWSKNFAGGAAGTRKTTLVLVAAWISLCVEAAWWAGASLVGGGGAFLAGLAVYVVVAAQLAWMLRRIGSFGLTTAVLFPIPLAFFLAVFARSIIDVYVRHRVTWKGRQLAT